MTVRFRWLGSGVGGVCSFSPNPSPEPVSNLTSRVKLRGCWEIGCFPCQGVMNEITNFCTRSYFSRVFNVHWPIVIISKVNCKTSDLSICILVENSFFTESYLKLADLKSGLQFLMPPSTGAKANRTEATF